MSILVSVALEYVGIYLSNATKDDKLTLLADSFPFSQSTFINITQKKVKKEVLKFVRAGDDDTDSEVEEVVSNFDGRKELTFFNHSGAVGHGLYLCAIVSN